MADQSKQIIDVLEVRALESMSDLMNKAFGPEYEPSADMKQLWVVAYQEGYGHGTLDAIEGKNVIVETIK